MIKMEIVFRSAKNTTSLVAIPDLELDRRRNETRMFKFQTATGFKIDFGTHQFEPKLEDISFAIEFDPAVGQSKEAVERPNSSVDLFIDRDDLG